MITTEEAANYETTQSEQSTDAKILHPYSHAETDERALTVWLRDTLIQAGQEVFTDTDIPPVERDSINDTWETTNGK